MKKIISIVLMTAMLLSLVVITASAAWDGSVAAAFEKGTGTEADPYVVATPAQLAFLAQSVKDGTTYEDKFIVLAGDIDLGGKEWMPIGLYKYGNVSGANFPFAGSFDGKGYTVSNFVITAGDNTIYAGLFAYVVGANSVMKNVVVANANVAGKNYAGALVGRFEGKEISSIVIEDDCVVTGTASVGGVAGRIVKADAKYLVNNATVTGTGNSNSSYIGGICGALGGNATLSYSVNKGAIGGDVAFSGGIVGLTGADSGAGNIENCYNAGAITYSGTKAGRYAGGVVGRLAHAADLAYSVKNTYNLAAVSAPNAESAVLGEIAAEVKNAGVTIENVYSVDVADIALVAEGKNHESTVVTDMVNKAEADIKALTAAIDTKIGENIIDTTPTPDPEPTPTPTPDPEPTPNPGTGDATVILAIVCVVATAGVVFSAKKREER